MFYSNTFLARKGPLGTVWCAAHLHHRLKKSHYATTHIPSTVGTKDLFSAPNLQLSSWAERIMFPEVPIALRMSGHLLLGVVRIYSMKIEYLYQDYNVLLNGIRKAFESSTEINLPKDSTRANSDDINISYPSNFDLNKFNFNEYSPEGHKDISEEVPGSEPVPIEEDSPPSIPIDANADFHDPGPSNQTAVNKRLNKDSNQESSPESAHIRDPDPRMVTYDPTVPNIGDDIVEPDTVVAKLIKEKDKNTQDVEEMVVSGGKPISHQEHQEPQSAPSEQGPDNIDSPAPFAESPNFVMQPSPPAEQPRPRRRKRLFDEKTVLTNKFMKKGIEDSSDLMRKRKDWCSSLGVWRLNNKQKQENIFLETSITGLSNDLCKVFNNDYISAKHHLVRIAEAHSEPNVPEPPSPVNNFDMETTNFHNFEGGAETNKSDQELSFLEEEDYRTAGARRTPDAYSSSGNQSGTPETYALSVSARAVAQYLLKKSPVTPNFGEDHGDLSLNTILEGKRRKLCARMFFETLVLKNCGLVDIKQDETYGDIILKVTPKLFKEQFSN